MIPLGVLASARVTPSAVGVTDSFNRVDSATTLGSTDSGQSWLTGSSVWGIHSGTAYKVSPNNTYSVALVPLGLNMDLSVTVAQYSAVTYVGLAARADLTAQDGYFMWLENVIGGGRIIRRIGGVNTILEYPTFTVGDRMRMTVAEEAGGTRVTAYRNGVEACSFVDSTAGRPMGTSGGLFNYGVGTEARLDDFQGVSL